ncbi:MAG: 23S rRNA (guanosine(2251)-2'-O)-methyltransferase RlmB [Paludibacteraceae bacterium]|nr:23S rRNA (guanosine(2251)-2'-O)-methyltransferase RlmB [Paludibacteraceae bacterium]
MKEKDMIFGIRAVIEAIKADKEFDKIFIRRDMSNELSRELYAALAGKQVPVVKVPTEKLNRLTMKNHQGVIAFITPVVYQRIEDIIPTLYEQGKTPFIVVLDSVTDVRNFGAIARTCECAGVDAIVIPVRGGAASNADAIKTSAGALLKIPVCREPNLTEALKFMRSSGLSVIAATEKAAQNYTEANYNVPLAIVMGAEDIGIAPENLRICDEMVCVPIKGTIASLNVSVAAGILIYEALKQR